MDPKWSPFKFCQIFLSSRVHVAKFDSDSSALQDVMVCCWIWQSTTASVCLNNKCLLINDDQNSGCHYVFNNTVLVLRGWSAVKCGCFQCMCMSHSQRSYWQNTGCHRKLETYLTLISRHCVRRDPNNQIRLRSPIYSPVMLIKWLRYQHESASYPVWKEVPLFTSADQILTRYGVTWYKKWIWNYNACWRQNRSSKVASIMNMHVFMNWMPDCNINRGFIRIFCPIHGWRRRPRGTGTTCLRTVHDQLYVSLGMALLRQFPLLIGWRNLMPMRW